MTHYDFSPYAVPTLMTTAALVACGVFVLAGERASRRVSLRFFLATLAISLWMFAFSWMYCAIDERIALWWAKVAYLGVPSIPAAIYHFTVAVLGIEARHARAVRLNWWLALLFTVTVLTTDQLITGVSQYWWGYYPRYGWLSLPYLAFFFWTMLVSLHHYWVAYRNAPPHSTHQRRVKGLLVAFGIVYLSSVDYLPKYGIAVYPFGYVPVLVFVGLVARLMWRYRLVDITPAFAAKQIIDTMGNALVVFDREGIVQIVNRAACELFGNPEAELIGHAMAELSPQLLTIGKLERLAREEATPEYELALPISKGQLRMVQVSISVMRDRDQTPLATVCNLRDITERKEAEKQLRRTNEFLAIQQRELLETLVKLKQAHQELQSTQLQLIQAAKLESVGQLAAGVAHEVKNPLAIIFTGVEYLAKQITSGNGRSKLVLDDMHGAVKRADAVIKGLLNFSAVRELDMRPESLNAVIGQALLLVKHELDKAHVQLVEELAQDLPAVRLDAQKIEQVFVNIFMNAIQAMPAGGTLTVRTSTQSLDHHHALNHGAAEDHLMVVAEVDDTGSGVPPDTLPMVFDPFFTTKPVGQGTGLGLAVSRRIIELHSGMIQIENRREGGARVTVVLHPEGDDPHDQASDSAH